MNKINQLANFDKERPVQYNPKYNQSVVIANIWSAIILDLRMEDLLFH